jgi:SpoVK/Ycf46/Vps4 family AAA+-type ATPase
MCLNLGFFVVKAVARKNMLEINLRGTRVDEDIDVDSIVAQLEGYSGDDIKNFCT